jgi:peptidoglycan/LPS O-acetylase OafA/YrhL
MTGRGHIGWLDGVRGIAILLVMLFHFDMLARRDTPLALDVVGKRITGFGWVGVDLFFVLSGFLITGILLDTKASAHRFRNFYARRAVRIFPLYYAFLAGLFIILPAVHAPASHDYAELRLGQGWYWLYLTNVWVLLRNGVGSSLFGTGHLWSLSIEEQFYLVWPAIIFALSRRSALAVCGAVIIAAPLVRIAMHESGFGVYAIYTFTAARVDPLAAGAALALALRSVRGRQALARAALPLACGSAVYLVALVAVLGDATNLTTGMEIFGLTPVFLMWSGLLARGLTCEVTLIRRIGNLAALRWTGRYSYAMYIFHWPIAVGMAAELGVRTIIPGSPIASEALFFALASATTALAAVTSWNLLEQPFLRLKRRFEATPTLLRPIGQPASIALVEEQS